jgi:MoxR-like ATPase
MKAEHPIAKGLTPRLDDSALRGRQGKHYHAEPGLIAAANVALTLERPLLLTGEPGCGKTDFAWAAASALAAVLGQPESAEPLTCYVRSDTRARDLLYTYDAVRRFGDAQHGGPAGLARASDPRNYITLEPLGRGLVSPRRRVVLIDEIDKAPRDLPNDLLRELDQSSFEILEIPEGAEGPVEITSHGMPLQRVMKCPLDRGGRRLPAPLVIITSNVERQLPDAFLRRCIFWHITFPEEMLPDILADHCPEAGKGLQEHAIDVFSHLRKVPGMTRRPGTAELIDWVAALTRVYDRAHAEREVRRFSGLVADKNPKTPWHDLPGFSCLVKLLEDQGTLARA